jgi:hypothetical protein
MALVNIRYKDNIKVGVKAVTFLDVDWIYIVPDVAKG